MCFQSVTSYLHYYHTGEENYYALLACFHNSTQNCTNQWKVSAASVHHPLMRGERILSSGRMEAGHWLGLDYTNRICIYGMDLSGVEVYGFFSDI